MTNPDEQLKLYGGGGIAEENYKKVKELKEKV